MKDLAKTREQVKAMLEALSDAFACFDDDNDIEGAVSDLNSIQKYIRTLLPEFGIYAWIREGMDQRHVGVFSSLKEAEERLNYDINMTLEDLEDLDGTSNTSHYNGVQKNGEYEVTVRDSYNTVSWKRMYDPSQDKTEGIITKQAKSHKDMWGVLTTYSFDESAQLRMFSTEKEAIGFLKKDFFEEKRIDEVENEWDTTCKHAEDYRFASITNHFNDRDDVTQWNVTNAKMPVSGEN